MKTRILFSSMLVALLLVGMLVPAAIADRPVMETSAQGIAKSVPAAANPEDVLWDQYANFSGTNLAAQDFEPAYDIYDVWTADDFENLEPWTIDTIVTRGGWTGAVDISPATSINWYICADAGGVPGCVPGDGTEQWTAFLPPTDPQVALGVFEPEDVVLTLDTPIELPAGTWWLVWQVALEFGLYGQYGFSTTSDAAWGSTSQQINPNNGFGMGTTWWVNDFFLDSMFRLEGTIGGDPEPDIRVDPTFLDETLCIDEQTTVELQICNDGTAPLDWTLSEIPGGGAFRDLPRNNGGANSMDFTKWLAVGQPARDVQPAAPSAPAASPEALNFYYDRPTFDGDFPGLPVEGYENYNYDPGILGFGMPLDQYTDNGLYSPGAILPGVSFWATGGDVGNELVAVAASAGWGNPDMLVAANTFVEDYVIRFDPPVEAAGMDLHSLMGVDYCDVDIYGVSGYIGSDANACTAPGVFWGVASDDPGDLITEIVISDQGDGAEGADNVAFGGGGAEPGIPWLSEDPTAGTVDPGTCETVFVTFDSTGLAPDTYLGELLIESNDPDEGEVYVPVTMTVEQCMQEPMYGKIWLKATYGPIGYRAIAQVRVKAGLPGPPIEGASVEFFLKDPDGTEWTETVVSNMYGNAKVRMDHATGGPWRACLVNITHPNYTWDPGDFGLCKTLWFGDDPPPPPPGD